jgi:hypothetical protein
MPAATPSRAIQPAPKPAQTRRRKRGVTQAEINKTLSATAFYDQLRLLIANGHGSVTVGIDEIDGKPNLRIITTISDTTPLPASFY